MDKTSGNLQAVIDGVLKANTFARQAEVQAWEQEFTPCEHTLCLQQEPGRQIDSQGMCRRRRTPRVVTDVNRSRSLLYVRAKKRTFGCVSNAVTWAVAELSMAAAVETVMVLSILSLLRMRLRSSLGRLHQRELRTSTAMLVTRSVLTLSCRLT